MHSTKTRLKKFTTKKSTASRKSLFLGVALLMSACSSSVSFGQAFNEFLRSNKFFDESAAIAETCQTNWNSIEEELTKISAALDSKNLDSIQVKTLGKTYQAARNIGYDSEILVELGEPAGVDFGFRSKEATFLIEKAAQGLKGTPAGKKIMGQAAKYKSKTDSKRAKVVKNVADLLAKEQADKAEKILRESISDVDQFVLWLSPNDAQTVRKQLAASIRGVSAVMKPARIENTKAKASQLVKSMQLTLDGLASTASKAALDIDSQGKTTIGGESCNGAIAFSKLCEEWRMTHAIMINAMGKEYAIKGEKFDFPLKDIFGANSTSRTWTDAGYELFGNMKKSLVKIIEADANKTSAADLPQKYAIYCQAIGAMSGVVTDKTFVEECEKSLAKLAAKDSAFESRVKNYRAATEDVLAWRNKVAASMAKAASAEFMPVKELVGTQKMIPKLKSSLSSEIPLISEKCVGKKTTFKRVYGLTETASYAGCEDRIWTGLKTNLLPKAAAKSLMKDLYLSGNQLPLSISAARALDGIQNSNHEVVGGTIKSVHAESLSVRMATLSPKMQAFFPIGDLPKDRANISDGLLRIAIEPEWVQNRYFFAKLK